jgi:hypothetical protein
MGSLDGFGTSTMIENRDIEHKDGDDSFMYMPKLCKKSRKIMETKKLEGNTFERLHKKGDIQVRKRN